MPELRELYQGHGPLPKSQGVPEGPQRKNHVGGSSHHVDGVQLQAHLVARTTDAKRRGQISERLIDCDVVPNRTKWIAVWRVTKVDVSFAIRVVHQFVGDKQATIENYSVAPENESTQNLPWARH